MWRTGVTSCNGLAGRLTDETAHLSCRPAAFASALTDTERAYLGDESGC